MPTAPLSGERSVHTLPVTSVECVLLASLPSLPARPSATCPQAFRANVVLHTALAAAVTTADEDALKNCDGGGW